MKPILFILLILLLGSILGLRYYWVMMDWDQRDTEQQTWQQEKEKRIFLDHGDVRYHAEVFYAVAVLLTKRIYPNWKMIFLIERDFAYHSGLFAFWEKHVKEGILGKL